jgi:hypothetical protein
MPNFLSGVLGGPVGGVYEPQRTNGALLYVTNIGAGGIDEVLTLSLKTFALPKVTNNPQMAQYLNEKRKFAGMPEWDDLPITFHDYVDLKTLTTLLAWRNQVYDPRTGKVGLKSQYAKNGFIKCFAPNGDFERQWDLIGIWPSNLDPGEIDMQGEDFVTITCNFVIDKAIPSTGLNGPSTGSSLSNGNNIGTGLAQGL